jgi:hypothetical protein
VGLREATAQVTGAQRVRHQWPTEPVGRTGSGWPGWLQPSKAWVGLGDSHPEVALKRGAQLWAQLAAMASLMPPPAPRARYSLAWCPTAHKQPG